MPEFRLVVCGLREGGYLTDPQFDRIYPDWVQELSEPHWTPIQVARRAAALLVVDSSTKVLDIGSGPGKFCLIGALTTEATFVGVEQRGNLVHVARETAQLCRATRARFLHANMMALDWSEFDSFYLFNPFYEHIADYLPPILDPVELSPTYYTQYVVATCVKLLSARKGTRVVTYHGFGGRMPPGFQRVLRERASTDFLELWEKV